MRFINILSFSVLVALSCQVADAQYTQDSRPKLEWHAGWGTTAFFGDIGGTSRRGFNISGLNGTDLSTVNPAYIVGIRRNLSAKSAIRTNLLMTKIEGMDFNANDQWRRNRNLSFKSTIVEASVQMEYTLNNFLQNSEKKKIFESYVFGGVGLAYFNPKAAYNGEWLELRPLGTEGQALAEGTKLYKELAAVLPLGFGFRYAFKNSLMIFGELQYHQTSTDYLDDVSTSYYDYDQLKTERGDLAAELSYRGSDEYPTGGGRGNSDKNDNYTTLTIGISKKLGKTTKKAVDPGYDDIYQDEED
jgi:Domain of unknown function (DUF6089)